MTDSNKTMAQAMVLVFTAVFYVGSGSPPGVWRRSFIASLGALSAANLAPASWLMAQGGAVLDQPRRTRGLAPNPADFLFAPGLVYLQIGSLGPTPRPVMEKAIAVWKEIELNPVFYAYGPHEQAVRGIAVDVKALGCHVYVASGHKWLLAPMGTGLLYLSEEVGHTVEPIALQDGRAVYSASSGVTNIPGERRSASDAANQADAHRRARTAGQRHHDVPHTRTKRQADRHVASSSRGREGDRGRDRSEQERLGQHLYREARQARQRVELKRQRRVGVIGGPW